MQSSKDFSSFVNPLNTALQRYSMTCPQRIAVFLSQVRHETAGLTIFFQSIDNGAGTLHMTPSNWPFACEAIPELKNAFGSCDNARAYAADPMGAATQNAAKSVFSDPLIAFLSGAWWFAEGASTPAIFGWKGCKDLRQDADAGVGSSAGGSDCKYTGNVQVTCCIFWTIGGSAGLTQRQDFYAIAKGITDKWSTSNAEEVPEVAMNSVDGQPTTAKESMLLVICIVGGVVIVVLLAIIIVMSRRMSRVESV
jgi:hypothetical protein